MKNLFVFWAIILMSVIAASASSGIKDISGLARRHSAIMPSWTDILPPVQENLDRVSGCEFWYSNTKKRISAQRNKDFLEVRHAFISYIQSHPCDRGLSSTPSDYIIEEVYADSSMNNKYPVIRESHFPSSQIFAIKLHELNFGCTGSTTTFPDNRLSPQAFSSATTQPPIIDGPTALCAGENDVTLSIRNPIPGATYEWLNTAISTSNWVSSPSGNNTNFIVHFTQSQVGYYYFKARIKKAGSFNTGPEGEFGLHLYAKDFSSLFTITNSTPSTSNYPPNYELEFTTVNLMPAGGCSYSWDWGDGTPIVAGTTGPNAYGKLTARHSFAQGRTVPYQVHLLISRTRVGGQNSTYTCDDQTTLPVSVFRPLCISNVPLTNQAGSFALNNTTGSIDFVPANALDCLPTSSLECLGGQGSTNSQVVEISMTAFADSLVQEEIAYRPGSLDGDPFLQGRGQVRPYATYTYQTALAPLANVNYIAGPFSAGFFDSRASARARTAAWVAPAIAERVSPNGEVLQERDPLGVHSATKYGYGHTIGNTPVHALPYLQVHNADANTVLFESFENRYANASSESGEDQLPLLAAEVVPVSTSGVPYTHTGTGAAQLIMQASGKHQLTLKPVPLTTQLIAEGLLFKCWLRLPAFNWAASSPIVGTLQVSAVNSSTVLRSQNLTVIAQVGDWCLVESQLALPISVSSQPNLTAGDLLVPRLQVTPLDNTNPPLWVDDVRLQPGGSQLTAYVYDPRSLRLLASFDDQHYALRYQYNSQGQLIRKQAETERGLKTLQETFYHTPQQPHP